MMKIILASQSPRRRELLKKIICDFHIVPSEVDEQQFQQKDPVQSALKAAEAKAKEVAEKYPDSLIIAADTVVFLGEEIFSKPKNCAEAKQMLEKLSGQKHHVITAIALYKKDEDRLLSDYEVSSVKFSELNSHDIENYLERGDYLDKAGSYAIQEIGDSFVEELEGDYDNVVGLPVKKLKKLIEEFLWSEVTISITDIAFPNDWGVGTLEKRVVFVPGAVIGDRVRVRIAKKRRSYSLGKMVKIEEQSPFRAEPLCPHFGSCGGCAFQNLLYEKQQELKATYLLQTLRKIARITSENYAWEGIIPSPMLFYYRNKMEFAFGGENREIFLGLRERTSPFKKYSKKTVPLKECLIFSKVVEQIFPVVTEFAQQTGLSSYNPLTRKGYFRNLVMREGKNSGETMLILVTKSGKTIDLLSWAEELKQKVPGLASFFSAENDRVSDVVVYERKEHVSGKTSIEEMLGGLKFRILPESFFQPNPLAAEILYERILKEAQLMGSKRVLGLYCGPGTIEIFLSRTAREVVGIDSERINILNAEENCRINNISNCRFREGTVEKILREISSKDFDLLVVDPPRAGLSREALKRVISLNFPAMIYVSCNPATFARDLALLAERGYQLQKLWAIDFFPHTPHLESLGIITK